MFVDLHRSTCLVIVVMQDRFVKHVQKYVRHVLKNVKVIKIWITVNNVHKYVMNVKVCREIVAII